MIGAIALLVFMVLIFPVGFFLSGALASAAHGELLTKDATDRFEGSELLDLQ
jgi:hypothetical protein